MLPITVEASVAILEVDTPIDSMILATAPQVKPISSATKLFQARSLTICLLVTISSYSVGIQEGQRPWRDSGPSTESIKYGTYSYLIHYYTPFIPQPLENRSQARPIVRRVPMSISHGLNGSFGSVGSVIFLFLLLVSLLA